ncbi:hypothetical protein [Xanthocytophaga agilis]|uniref:Uncharacterized protein n=1 Tax=Xanthocytophaga agilis TaxID=3048010 RepID=A0AAE3UC36_9BACT|nr:hypothetical protein [Xanthocytophaga agilis]MDJ1500503.1 hypothetical protein [Xanthocytophaga agilis]
MAATNEQVARKWAAVTCKKFRSELQRLKVRKSGNLSSSFQAFVQAEAGGDSVKIRMLYLLYGKFSDMGVGKGKRLGSGSNVVTKLVGGSAKKPEG